MVCIVTDTSLNDFRGDVLFLYKNFKPCNDRSVKAINKNMKKLCPSSLSGALVYALILMDIPFECISETSKCQLFRLCMI